MTTHLGRGKNPTHRGDQAKQSRLLLPHGFFTVFLSIDRSCCSEEMGVALDGVIPAAG